jgi:predicted phosphodiesterase
MRPVFETIAPFEPRAVVITGDPHIGKHPETTELLRQDLEDAKARGDWIIVWGDVRQWITPNDRKRYSAKEGDNRDALVNKWVNELVRFFEPFVDNIIAIKLGNHETSLIKHSNTDPIVMLVDRLNQLRSPDLQRIVYAGYTAWWLVRFINTNDTGQRVGSVSCKFWLHHGAGGSAPVTKGALDRARIQDAIIGADVYVIGHKHTAVSIPTQKEHCDDYGNVRRRTVDFIIVPGYSAWSQELPDEDGYNLDWSSETFYGLESVGCVRIEMEPVSVCSTVETKHYVVKRKVTAINHDLSGV